MLTWLMNHYVDLIKLPVTLLSSDICQIIENMPTINRTSGQDSRKDQGSNTEVFLHFYSRIWLFPNECDLALREIDSYLIMASVRPLSMLQYNIPSEYECSLCKTGTCACNGIKEIVEMTVFHSSLRAFEIVAECSRISKALKCLFCEIEYNTVEDLQRKQHEL